MRKIFVNTGSILVIFYLLLMSLGFFQQENFIFFPQKLAKAYKFGFDQEFEEIFIPIKDGITLHGILFKGPAPAKGLVFYLHGNAGSLDSWGWIAQTYTALHYDIFVLDYRGYGKSEGVINNENQFYEDVQAAYDYMKTRYAEDRMVIAGYSIGTAAAARLASVNNPKLLILQAPFYSLTDLMQSLYPFIPAFVLKYKFETFRFLEKTRAPVALFHGDQDEIIYQGSSEKLRPYLKPTDKMIILEGQGHNGMNENPEYQKELARVLVAVE